MSFLSYFNSSMLLFIYIFISHFTYWTKYIKYKHWIFWVIHTVYIEHFLFLSGHEAAESDPFSLAPCGVCAARKCVYVGVCIRCNGRKVKNLFVDHFLLYWPIARALSILMDISLFLHLYTCVVRNQNWPLFFYIWPPFSLQRFLCSSPFLMEKIKSRTIFFLVQYATRIYITIGKKSWTQFPVHGDFNLFFLSFGVFGFFLVRAIYLYSLRAWFSGWILCVSVYCMIESISGEHFFHSALLDSLTISVWHIQMIVTHHHTLTLIHFTFPQVFACTQSHWTIEHSELWNLREIRTSKDFSLLNCNYLHHQEYLHILCFAFSLQ